MLTSVQAAPSWRGLVRAPTRSLAKHFPIAAGHRNEPLAVPPEQLIAAKEDAFDNDVVLVRLRKLAG
ncbi:tubulin alpha chain [Culex quinquefasciatus]|uniref:Tubulin alpha chain n=1 Tax=Culex quinquefasciatus TaxID=7176 RepID=B0XGI3_CULQU|nr:tubulin alpha chain [Culex quinquefasciatus]|eukprot:XP_001868755.1 tubulin alpha chain [Culex quinquefasciatus]